MKTIFLAAGAGTRLRPYTDAMPKCMVPFRGRPLIDHLVRIHCWCGVDDVVIVRGHLGDRISVPDARYYTNPRQTNMVDSLFRAEPELSSEFVLSYADILYEPRVLKTLLDSTADIAVVVDIEWEDYYTRRASDPYAIAESLRLEGDRLVEIGRPADRSDPPEGQYIGLLRFSSEGARRLREVYTDLRRTFWGKPWRGASSFENAYMTDLLQELIDRGHDVRAVSVRRGWLEFDTASDYEQVLAWDEDGSLSDLFDGSALGGVREIGNPKVVSAGGMPVRAALGGWETALVGSGTPVQWRIPKGMQDSRESVEETALREVREETGLSTEIVAYLDTASWTYQYGGRDWDETCHFFLMAVTGGSFEGHDAKFDRIEWVSIDESVEFLSYEAERCVARLARERLASFDPTSWYGLRRV